MDKKSNIETMKDSLKAAGWSEELIDAAIGVSSQLPVHSEVQEFLSVDFIVKASDSSVTIPTFTSHNYTQGIKVS